MSYEEMLLNAMPFTDDEDAAGGYEAGEEDADEVEMGEEEEAEGEAGAGEETV